VKDILHKVRNVALTYGGRVLRPLVAETARKRLAALDINNYQIKLAVVHMSKGKIVLEAIHMEKVEEEENETAGLGPEQVSAIHRIVKEYNLSGCDVVASLPYSSYAVRLVVLPKMPNKELRNAILLDQQNYATASGDEAVVDFVTVNSFQQEGAEYENHLVAAINRDLLAEQVAALSAARLVVRGFSVAPLALRNVLGADESLSKESVYAVVNLSHEETSFSMIECGKLLFTREIPRTSDELTEALRTIVVPGGETVHLTHERAQEIKYEYGIIDESMKGEETEEGIPLEHVAIMMRPVLEKMLVEIRRSIDFCQEQFGVDPPERVFLSGGGATLGNLAEFLSSKLRLPVDFVDPAKGFEVGPYVPVEALHVGRLSLASAMGASMNLSGGRSYFAPAEFVPSDYRYVRMGLRASLAASVVAVVASLGLSTISASRTGAQLATRTATLERLSVAQEKYRVEADQIRLRRFRRDALLSLIGPEVPWGDLLKDLSHRVDAEVQLTSMQTVELPVPGSEGLVEHRVRFAGLISLRRNRLESVTSDLLEEFNDSPYFDDVRLEAVYTLDDDIASLDFSCRLLF
jgi:type IV pilus assembly protein PilM